MILLSIDCAGSGCGVCVFDGQQVLAHLEETMERGQDARLIPMVQEVMAKAGLDYGALDRIAVTKGPGSFTGLRIGLAAARGIGFAAGKPVVGIDRFSIYRAGSQSVPLLVVLESRRAELYTKYYSDEQADHAPALLTLPEIEQFLGERQDVATIGDVRIDAVAVQRYIQPSEAACITAARLAVEADPSALAFLPRPLYLRPPDVTIKACEASTC